MLSMDLIELLYKCIWFVLRSTFLQALSYNNLGRERERERERERFIRNFSITGWSRARPGDRRCMALYGLD